MRYKPRRDNAIWISIERLNELQGKWCSLAYTEPDDDADYDMWVPAAQLTELGRQRKERGGSLILFIPGEDVMNPKYYVQGTRPIDVWFADTNYEFPGYPEEEHLRDLSARRKQEVGEGIDVESIMRGFRRGWC